VHLLSDIVVTPGRGARHVTARGLIRQSPPFRAEFGGVLQSSSQTLLPAAHVGTSIDVQDLTGHMPGLGEIEHRLGDVPGLRDFTQGR